MGLMQQDMKQPGLVLACLYGVSQVGQGGLFSWQGVTKGRVILVGLMPGQPLWEVRSLLIKRLLTPCLPLINSFWLSL